MRVVVLLIGALQLLGCGEEGPLELGVAGAALAPDPAALTVLLPWGSAVTQRAPQPEFAGDGPSGIALTDDGGVLIVDRLGGRVLRVDQDGARALFAVDEHFEQIAVGPSGKVALYSPLLSLVRVIDERGGLLGELTLPRAISHVSRLSFGASSTVLVDTAFQERFDLGSIHAPRSEAEIMRSKLELGLVTLVSSAGEGSLVSRGAGPDGRTHERSRISLGADLAQAELAWSSATRALVLVSSIEQPGAAIVVRRSALLIDLEAGTVLGQTDLPARGTFSVRESIAVGGGEPALAYMLPEAAGLRVVKLPLASLEHRGAR